MARDIDVNKNTAWLMLMRIRRAMIEHGDMLQGIVEADETYIGGKAKNMHKAKREAASGSGKRVSIAPATRACAVAVMVSYKCIV